MEQTNNQINEFIKAIRITDGQSKEAKRELDFIKDNLPEYIRSSDDNLSFVKALKSGSYAKGTALKRHKSGDFDADIAIYVSGDKAQSTELDNLLDYIESGLREIYRNRTKRKPEFDPDAKSSVKVIFEDTPKINIDAVPIIHLSHPSIPNWGVIPRRDGEKRYTSVTEHVEFIRKRNKPEKTVNFSHFLMLMKWWRNHAFSDAEQKKVSSFFLELVFAKAFDQTKNQITDDWLQGILQMCTWVLRHRLVNPISFSDSRVPKAEGEWEGDVIVIDSVNNDNNIAHDWTSDDRVLFLSRLDSFCNHVQDAQNEANAGDYEEAELQLEHVFPNFINWTS